MTSLRRSTYQAICEELNEKPLRQIEYVVESSTHTLDVSQVYLPRKHLECFLRYVEVRPDIDELILDGTLLKTEDVMTLKEYLLRACVSKVSLRQIKLDAASAAALRQLCINNPIITSISLDDTCIPPSKIEEIQLIVSLNRLNADSQHSLSAAGTQSEAPHLGRWQTCRETRRLAKTCQADSSFPASKTVIDEFVSSSEPVFHDASFRFVNCGSAMKAANSIRWKEYSEMSTQKTDPISENPPGFTASSFFDNSAFCAALNALRPYDSLTKSLLLRGFPTPGLYVFRLFVNGVITEIVVDDTLPCLLIDGHCSLVGIKECAYPCYGALLEKATAKVVGGYDFIADLSFCDCIELLTGATCFQLEIVAPPPQHWSPFEILRALSERGEKLVACPIPRTQRERQSLEEIGICPGFPYTILKVDVCRKNGVHYAFVVQLSAPLTQKPLKYAFEYNTFRSEVVNGRSVIWLTLEDFAVVFESVFLIKWPFDDVSSDHKTDTVFSTICESPTESTLFANNTTYSIENKDNGHDGVLVTVSSSNPASDLAGVKCLFYRSAEPTRDGPVRRYDISEKNCMFASKEFWNGEGSFFFSMLPREKLQMTIASHTRASISIRFSTLNNVELSLLHDALYTSTAKGTWNTPRHGRRLSDFVFCFTNKSHESNASSVISLAQPMTKGPPFPLGILGWKGDSVDVVDPSKPHFTTEQEKQYMSVHSLFISMEPNESLFLIPYCCGVKCPEAFDLTLYSAAGLTKSLYQTAALL